MAPEEEPHGKAGIVKCQHRVEHGGEGIAPGPRSSDTWAWLPATAGRHIVLVPS